MYVLKLNPKHPSAWTFNVTWSGYWAGLGYVEKSKDAIKFRTKKDAIRAMRSTLVGLNGLLDLYRVW